MIPKHDADFAVAREQLVKGSGRSGRFSRRRLALAALAVGSVAVTLALGELVMRSFFPTTHRSPPPRDPGVWKRLLHRASDTPGLSYELAPNVSMERWNLPLRTNSVGMRDREPLPDDAPNLLRIGALGDSFTFGPGIRAKETYPNVLEKMLEEAYPGRAIEVLNMAVSGYSTADEVQVLRHKVLPLKPQLITVGYYLNDPEIEPVQPLHSAFAPVRWWQHSTLLRRLDEAFYSWHLRRYGDGDHYRYLAAPNGPTWPRVVEAFGEMAALAQPLQIPVVFVIFPEAPPEGWSHYQYADLHEQVSAAAREAGLEVIDLLEPLKEYFSPNLRVVPDDHHPSPLAHRVAARSLFEYLQAQHAAILAAPGAAAAGVDQSPKRDRPSTGVEGSERLRP